MQSPVSEKPQGKPSRVLEKLQGKPSRSSTFLSYLQIFSYSVVEVFRANPFVDRFFETGIGRPLYNFSVVFFSIWDFRLKLQELQKAKNKNFVVVGNFLASLISGLCFSVVALGCLIASALFTPVLFIVTAAYIG